jgi:hypothetical protein
LTIASVNPQTIVTSSINPSMFGQPVTFTATVTPPLLAPALTPTGTVTFYDGTSTLGTAPLSTSTGSFLPSGVSTFSPTTPLSVGTHTITAVYSGDSNFASNTSMALRQTINKAASTTVITSSANPAMPGQIITFYATVTATAPATSTPTGTILFIIEGSAVAMPLRGGQAFIGPEGFPPGTYPITAIYLGDDNFTYSASMALMQTVVPPAPPSQNQAFVTQLYQDLLGRAPDPSGLQYWGGALDASLLNRTQVIQGIENSLEYRVIEVNSAYQQILGRQADAVGLNNYVPFLQNGGTVEQLKASLGGSQEFFNDAQAQDTTSGLTTTNQIVVDFLFQKVLKRTADPGGVVAFTNALASGTPAPSVALAIISSPEAQSDLVQSYYRQFLKRPADSTGLNGFTQALLSGVRDETIIASLVASTEYFGLV